MRYTHHDSVVPRRAFSLALILFFAAASALTLGCDTDEDDAINIEPALEQEVEDDFPAVSETMEDLDEDNEGMTYIPTTPAMPTDTDEPQLGQQPPAESTETLIIVEPVDTPTEPSGTTSAAGEQPSSPTTDAGPLPRGGAQFDVDDAQRELDDPMAGPDQPPRGSAQFDLPTDETLTMGEPADDSMMMESDTGEDDMYGEAVLDEDQGWLGDGFQSVARTGAETGACAGVENIDRASLTLPVSLQTALVDPLQYTGLAVDGEVEVLEAVTDRGFWIERPDGERLFVLLKEKHEFDERIHIQDGQRIQLQGVLLSSSAIELLAGDVDPDSRKIIEGLDVFLATPYKGIQIVDRPADN